MFLASLVLNRVSWLLVATFSASFAFIEGGLSNTATLVLAPLVSVLVVVLPVWLKNRYDRKKQKEDSAAHASDTMATTGVRVAELTLDERKWLREQADELFEQARAFWNDRDAQKQKVIDSQCALLTSQQTMIQMLQGVVDQERRA